MQTPHLQDVSMDEMQHISLGSDRRINIEDPAGPQTLLAEINDLRATCHLLKERLTSVEKRTAEDRTLFFRSLGAIVVIWVLSILLFFVMRPKSVDTDSNPMLRSPPVAGTNGTRTSSNLTIIERIEELEEQTATLAWRSGPSKMEPISRIPSFLKSMFHKDVTSIDLTEENLGSFASRLKKFKKAELVAQYSDMGRLKWDISRLATEATDLLLITRCENRYTGMYMSYFKVQTTGKLVSKGNGFLFDLNHAKIYPELPKITTSDYFRNYLHGIYGQETSSPAVERLDSSGVILYRVSGRTEQYQDSLQWSFSLGTDKYLLEVVNARPNDPYYRNVFIAKLTSKPSPAFGINHGLFPLETMEVDDYQVYQLLP